VVISIWTFSRFSHEEIGFRLGSKWCYFSSTNRDGAKGTRWIDDDKLFKHPERWKVIEYEVDDAEAETKRERANSIKGLPYDWKGIFLGQTVPIANIHNVDKWYCCEACDYVDTGIIRKSSPGSDYKMVCKLHNCKDVEIDNDRMDD